MLVFYVFAALAEFIRALIVPGNNESLDAARARGARRGRPLAMTDEQVGHARDRILDEARSNCDPLHLVRLFGIHPRTAITHLYAAHPGRFRPDVIAP
ncbi:hypothetical protein OG758_00675 [Streptomyces sp. NBC_01474]|uniref:hypothetical protein n=1 Tax=Streptomyces sp. NBC_01474 TaxID=2903880 RepID=UPI002DD839B8|nr:hypothetical protein [Streptomyces sp. NBC_01474]WSD92874.1 hypothetical protein OG758_00675 [Streptomyces sp. NBC_01474]